MRTTTLTTTPLSLPPMAPSMTHHVGVTMVMWRITHHHHNHLPHNHTAHLPHRCHDTTNRQTPTPHPCAPQHTGHLGLPGGPTPAPSGCPDAFCPPPLGSNPCNHMHGRPRPTAPRVDASWLLSCAIPEHPHSTVHKCHAALSRPAHTDSTLPTCCTATPVPLPSPFTATRPTPMPLGRRPALGWPPTAYLLSPRSDPTHGTPMSHTDIQGHPTTRPKLHGPIRATWPPTDACRASVGEVRSGLVPGHFCWTRDPMVPSLTQFLGPGPGLPRTVYISLVLVQTRSRQSCTFYLFIYSRLGTAGSCGTARCPAAVGEPSAQCRTAVILLACSEQHLTSNTF